MSRQVHCIMEDPQNLQDVVVNAKGDHMAWAGDSARSCDAFARVARVEESDAFPYVVDGNDTGSTRVNLKVCDRLLEECAIAPLSLLAELLATNRHEDQQVAPRRRGDDDLHSAAARAAASTSASS
jgi:hypothetical protein